MDEAIRARFNLIPFTVTIPPDERDPGLSEKLWAEAPGILAWMIEGCWDWRNVRLRAPVAVSDATSEYFDSEDATMLWIADCCETGSTYSEMSGKMFASWKAWASSAGETVGSHKAFSRTMERHGFVTGKKTKNGAPIKGLRFPVPRPYHETGNDRD